MLKQKKIKELICFLENKDWESFYQLSNELHEKTLQWLNEDNPSKEQIEYFYYLIANLIDRIKKEKKTCRRNISLTGATYLDMDDLTFYY